MCSQNNSFQSFDRSVFGSMNKISLDFLNGPLQQRHWTFAWSLCQNTLHSSGQTRTLQTPRNRKKQKAKLTFLRWDVSHCWEPSCGFVVRPLKLTCQLASRVEVCSVHTQKSCSPYDLPLKLLKAPSYHTSKQDRSPTNAITAAQHVLILTPQWTINVWHAFKCF